MEPNDILREEHEAIELLVSAMEGMSSRLGTKAAFPRGDLERALTVVVEFADKCHHAKEEKALFPALSRASPKTGAELARRLTSDHVAFRKIIGSTRDLLAAAEADEASRGQVAKNLGTYARLIRDHIRVETDRLFPEVRKTIPSKERAKLAEEFERIEEEVTGPGAHEKYHEMIHELAHAYAH